MSHKNLNGSTVLVTGSSGFIGSHLCRRLVSDWRCEVVGIDSTNQLCRIVTNNKESAWTEAFEYIHADIGDRDKIENVCKEKKFDFIFHLAAVANPRTCKANFDLAMRVNVLGTRNIIECAGKDPQLVFISSAAVYGNPRIIPISEEHPTDGDDPYAITKMIGENLCKCYSKNYEHEICVARNFNTFGSGQVEDYIIPTLVKQALLENKIEIWNSDPIRDFLYIDDTISALTFIAERGRSGKIYNIGSGVGKRIGDVAYAIRDIVNKDLEVNDLRKHVLGSYELVAENEKLKSLGWKVKIDFWDGLRRTIEWYRSLIGTELIAS